MLSRLALPFLILATGCGSTAMKAPTNASTATVAPSTKPTQSRDASSRSNVESQRAAFIEDCMRSSQAEDYCACGFAQVAEVFKDVDFSQDLPKDDPRMAEAAARMKASCSDKFPEEKAREKFLLGCVENDPKREPYCTCAWSELRNTLSVGDILTHDPPGSAKWSDAKKGIPKACKGKYPADVASNDFMSDCKRNPQHTDKQCQCRWKKLTRKFSIEDLVAGTADPSQVKDLDKCN